MIVGQADNERRSWISLVPQLPSAGENGSGNIVFNELFQLRNVAQPIRLYAKIIIRLANRAQYRGNLLQN